LPSEGRSTPNGTEDSEETGRQKDGRQARADRHRDRQTIRQARRQGRFKESDDVGKSLTADRRVKAKTKVKSGQGDKGDQ